jgi:hypothetical protein
MAKDRHLVEKGLQRSERAIEPASQRKVPCKLAGCGSRHAGCTRMYLSETATTLLCA